MYPYCKRIYNFSKEKNSLFMRVVCYIHYKKESLNVFNNAYLLQNSRNFITFCPLNKNFTDIFVK